MTAVDDTHPVDLIDPEIVDVPERGLSPSQFRRLVIRIARTFFTGNPKITVVAWRIVAGDTWESIRACSRRVGCSAQAVSRRLAIIKDEFGIVPSTAHRRRFSRWLRQDEFQEKLRRGATQPPADFDEQLQTNDLPTENGRPSTNGRGVNDSSGSSAT
jgi:hypothetical protein